MTVKAAVPRVEGSPSLFLVDRHVRSTAAAKQPRIALCA